MIPRSLLAHGVRILLPLPKGPPRRIPIRDRRVCMVSVLNDAFTEYFLVLLHSILAHNPWFALDIRIIVSSHLSPLSEENRQKIRSLYPRITFTSVDASRYERFLSKTPRRLWPALLTLEAFSVRGYDTVVFFDADMLCLGDISELFETDIEFGACMPGKDREVQERGSNVFRRGQSVNSGVLVIGKRYLTDATYRRLFRYSSGPTADQDILNRFLLTRPVYLFHHRYNYNAQFFWDGPGRDVRLLHYTGPKPLDSPSLPQMGPWLEEYRKMRGSS